MTVRIADIFASRKLKELFDLTGRYSPQLDETIVPTVVIEQFQVSDINRGPVEAFAAALTPTPGVGDQAWFRLRNPLPSSGPEFRKRLRVLQVGMDASGTTSFIARIMPSVAIGAATVPTAIWQDRIFSATLPAGNVEHSNLVETATPAGGVDVFRGRFTAGQQHLLWEPNNCMLAPGHDLLVLASSPTFNVQFFLGWAELDYTEPSRTFR